MFSQLTKYSPIFNCSHFSHTYIFFYTFSQFPPFFTLFHKLHSVTHLCNFSHFSQILIFFTNIHSFTDFQNVRLFNTFYKCFSHFFTHGTQFFTNLKFFTLPISPHFPNFSQCLHIFSFSHFPYIFTYFLFVRALHTF